MTFYILIMTFFILSRDSLLYSNMTLIASMPQYKYLIIAHLIILSLYYRKSLHFIYKKIDQTPCIVKHLINITSIMMIIGAFIPYTYLGVDILSILHVFFCMISSVLFLLILFIYNYYISIFYGSIYRKTHYFFETGLSFLCLVTVFFTSINGYVEMIYCVLVTIYIHMLKKEFKQI